MKQFFTILIVILIPTLNIYSQQFPWSAFFGNEGAEFAYDIKQTSDNGYIVAAYANDGGSSDFYVVKLDPFGDLTWERIISKDAYTERAFSVMETQQGDYVIVGNATNFNKPWIVKLNALGDTLWTTQWTNSVFNNSGLLARGTLLPDGRIVVISHTDYYALDPYLFIVGQDGELLEERDLESLVPLGWFSGTTIQDVEATSDGGFILTGGAGSGTGSRAYLWKFDANADSTWSVIYDDQGLWMRYAQSVKQLSDGGYILTGATAPNTTTTAAMRTNAEGEVIWYQSYPDSLYTNGTDLIEWKSGEILIAEKRFNGFGSTFFESALLRLDSLGNLLSRELVIGSDSSTTITQMRRTNDGGFVMAGEINEYLSVGEQDLFVLKSDSLGNISGVSIDYVWPGDVNYDGIVNMADLMILGVTAGATGPEREDKSIEWYPHYVTDWADTVVTGVNFKHADTDGNGLVEILDTLAIVINYDSTHNYTFLKSSYFSENDLFVIPQEAMLIDEKRVEIPVYLGSEDKMVEDLYGIFFTMLYDDGSVLPGSTKLIFEDSWLGLENENIWELSKSFPTLGLTDFGITRSDHQSVSGYGQIGVLSFELLEELTPGNGITFELAFSNLHAHNYNLYPIELVTSTFEITINNFITGMNPETQEKVVNIYPNPALSGNTIFIEANDPIKEIRIYNLDGKQIYETNLSGTNNTCQLNNLNEKGIFLLRVLTTHGLINKRIVIQ
jgi:hypothetical protein